jgi:hypothetical protein
MNNSVTASRKTSNQNFNNIMEDINPIKKSSFELCKPVFGLLPNNFYITNTNIDENLIEVE